jgi:dTMP kinase
MYVVIEGIDTCGKSTQISLLKEALPNAVFTKEPGGTFVGQKLREILLGEYELDKRAEFLMFLADRAQHTGFVVKPTLDSGKTLISDRSLISGLAYSDAMFDENFKIEVTKFAMNGFLPDLAVLLELDSGELVKRLGNKTHDRIERQGIEYLMNVQSNMEKYSKILGIRLLKIPANTDRVTICNMILNEIKETNA